MEREIPAWFTKAAVFQEKNRTEVKSVEKYKKVKVCYGVKNLSKRKKRFSDHVNALI